MNDEIIRVIAVVCVSDGLCVQTKRFKITNPIGSPAQVVKRLCEWDVDEIVLLDITRGRRTISPDFLRVIQACRDVCYLPMMVGGKIGSVSDGRAYFEHGADGLVLNSGAAERPGLIGALAARHGCQAVTVSVDWRHAGGFATRNGTADGDGKAEDHCRQAVAAGAGQLIFNHTDYDGTTRGYALEQFGKVVQPIPCIAFGGGFEPPHFVAAVQAGFSAVAAGNVFHQREHATRKIKLALHDAGIRIALSPAITRVLRKRTTPKLHARYREVPRDGDAFEQGAMTWAI